MRKFFLFLFIIILCNADLYAQTKTVTGTIYSSVDNAPLSGVSVRIKGRTTGVITDNNGSYNISAGNDQTLEFNYIGYKLEERLVGDNTVINVVLSQQEGDMNEVVVTAYGIQRDRKSLGYSTPIVSGDEVSNTQRENFMNGLAGRVPGLFVNTTSGDPGASTQMFLRGIVSISGDNSPLLVIDGLPIDNSVMNQSNLIAKGSMGTNRDQDYSNRAVDLNPADIESYTILKGPEATALYGNLGSSGAIIITTKKAKAGRGTVSYSNSFRFEKQLNFPEVQQVYSQGASNGIYNPASRSYFGPKYPDSLVIYDNIHNFFQVGNTQKHSVVFEGGSQGFTYRWSNEYTDNNGTVPTTNLTRLTSRLTATAQILPKLTATSTFSYMNTSNIKATKGSTGYLMSLLSFPSRFDVRNYIDELGNRVLTTGTIYSEVDNPFWDLNKNLNQDKTNRFLGNSSLTYKPLAWLNITGTFGADVYTTNGMTGNHPQSYRSSGSAASPTGGRLSEYQQVVKILNGSLVASARHKFGNFNNTYIIGSNFNDYNYRTNSQVGESFYDPNFYSMNNTLPTTQRSMLSINNFRGFGVFGQAVLGYKTILYLTLTGRMDAASRLMPNNPYFFYPAVSTAFNFSDLESVKKWGFLTQGKLRASFAYTGKEPRYSYALRTRLLPVASTGGGFNYDLATGGNDKLKPEFTRNIEAGLEAKFLNNRIGFDFTIYNLKSLDQIIRPRLSYGSGFALKLMNGGEVENKGFEIQITGTPIENKNFIWDVVFNITHNKGTVISIAEELPEFYDSDTWLQNGIRSSVYPGASTGAFGGWVSARNDKGELLINPQNGLPLLKNDTDFYPIGDRTPKALFGLSNNLSYKNLALSFLIDFRYGGDVYNATQYTLYTTGLSTKTLDRETPRIYKGVLRDGLENTDNPTPNNIVVTPYYYSSFYTSTSNGVSPDMFVERDINAMRVRDITLSYVFPKRFFENSKIIKDLSLFTTATDVLLITNYSGIDPDSNGNTAGVAGLGGFGLDFGNMGRPIGVNFGMRLKL